MKQLRYVGPMTRKFALRVGGQSLRITPKQTMAFEDAVADEILATHSGLFDEVSRTVLPDPEPAPAPRSGRRGKSTAEPDVTEDVDDGAVEDDTAG